jgi:hypothetical protein
MELFVDLPQVFAIDMRVDLRRRDICVTQHLLHGTQVGAALEEVRRE